MSSDIKLVAEGDRAVEVHGPGGGLLLRYVFRPDTPPEEAPRPYAHPIKTLAGEAVTRFRPEDHPWHHALSFTITCLSGHNFWGGPSYRNADGYQWRGDQGHQHHVAWLEKSDLRLAHTIEWRTCASELLLREERALTVTIISSKSWRLGWAALLKNVSGRVLQLGQYYSNQGLLGSHYTGLQFRGAPTFLDDHGDDGMGIFAEGGLTGESAVHGAPSQWMEWRGRKVTIHFANNTGPLHSFIRRNNPLAALPFQYNHDLALADGALLALDHTLTFTDA